MPRPLPHERRHLPRYPLPEEEPTHAEIFDAVMEIRERVEKIEEELRRR